MKGKELCEVLKRFRQEIAENNDIEYTPHPCHNEEDCEGTCPLCEQEASILYEELTKRANQGLTVFTESKLLDELKAYKDKMEQIQFDNQIGRFWHFVFLIDQSEQVNENIAKAMEKNVNDTLSVMKLDPYTFEIAKVSIVTFGERIEEFQSFKNLDEVANVNLIYGCGKYNLKLAWNYLLYRNLSQKSSIQRTSVYVFTAGYDEETLNVIHAAIYCNEKSYGLRYRFKVISYKKEHNSSDCAVYYQDFSPGSLFCLPGSIPIRTSGDIESGEEQTLEELPPPPEINIVI